MLFLRQMGIAFLACIVLAVVAGTILAVTELVIGPIRVPEGIVGGVLQVAWLVLGFVLLQQIYIRIERWDAIRSGRTPQR